MADTISVTSKLPLGFPAAEGLTIMPGTTDVDAKAWAAWKATEDGRALTADKGEDEPGDVFETPPLPPPKADDKGGEPKPAE